MSKRGLCCIALLLCWAQYGRCAPFVYVTNQGANTVTKIDTATNTVVATIAEGGPGPFGIAITHDGKEAYVSNSDLNTFMGNTVTPIDLVTDTVEKPITVGMFPLTLGSATLSCHMTTMYVANGASNSVSPIDIATKTAGPEIPVGILPVGIAVSPDMKIVYVCLQGEGTVTRIDALTNTVTGTPFSVGGPGVDSIGIAITPNGLFAYVANQTAGNVVCVNVVTNITVATISVGGSSKPTFVAITPDGKRAYVTCQNTDQVVVIDTATNTIVTTIDNIFQPIGVAIEDTGKTVYVASVVSGVIPIDVATDIAGSPIFAGFQPAVLAITPLFTATASIKQNIFLDHTELVGVITWSAAPSDVAFYRIYQGDRVIGCVKATADPLQFFVPLNAATLPQFTITAVDKDGSESRHIMVYCK